MKKKVSHFYIQSAALCVALAVLLALQAVARAAGQFNRGRV